jgi:hypothetical protein
MRQLILAMVLVFMAIGLTGCISLGEDARLTEIAKEEWLRSGPAEQWRGAPVKGFLCIGSPAVMGSSKGYLGVYVPWPWNYSEFMTRVIMRYEMSKAAYQLHGVNRDGSIEWYFPYLWLDGLLHFPPSELHSWYRVFFPGEKK